MMIRIKIVITINRRTFDITTFINKMKDIYTKFINSDVMIGVGEIDRMKISVFDVIKYIVTFIF
ncbi:MAG: hypothetical protein ACKVPJ_11000 [Chitinophagales bacterium]